MVTADDDGAKCILCERVAEQSGGFDDDLFKIECDICGTYYWAKDRAGFLAGLPRSERLNLSSISRELNLGKQQLRLTEESTIRTLLSSVPMDLLGKLDRLLTNLSSMTKHAGERIVLRNFDFPLGHEYDGPNFTRQLEILNSESLVKYFPGQDQQVVIITVDGLRRVRELQESSNVRSNTTFVAMWFDAKMDIVWQQAIKPAVESTGFKPIQMKGVQHNDRIDSLIFYHIKRSRFIVADVTGQRPAVYYEAGFAAGIGIPVIWTCNKSEERDVSFDTRQFNHIFWSNESELRDELENRILGTIGGVVKAPIH